MTKPKSVKKTIAMVISLVVIVWAVETMVLSTAQSYLSPTNLASQIISSKLKLIDEQNFLSSNKTLLFLGDSFVSTGINTKQISKNLPSYQAYNLGLAGSSSVAGIYQVLQRYFKKHKLPQKVYILITPQSLSYPLDKIISNGRYFRFFNRPNELLSAYDFIPISEILKSSLSYLFPSSHFNLTLKDIPRKWDGIRRVQKQIKKNITFLKNLKSNDGFSPVNQSITVKEDEDISIKLTPFNRMYLDKIFKLLDSKNIAVGFSLFTMPKSIYQHRLQNPEPSHDKFYQMIKSQYPQVELLEAPPFYPTKAYGTPTHFRSQWANQYSTDIEKLIQNDKTLF